MGAPVIEVDSSYRKLHSLIFKTGLRRTSFEEKETVLFNCFDLLKLRQSKVLGFFSVKLNIRASTEVKQKITHKYSSNIRLC